MSYILDALKKSEEKRGTLHVPLNRPAYAPKNAYRQRRFGLSIMFIVAALVAGWFIAQWQLGPDRQAVQGATPASVNEVSVKQHKTEKNRAEMFELDSVEQKAVDPLLATETMQSSSIPENSTPVMRVEEQQSVFRPVTPASPAGEMNSVPISGDDAHLNATSNRAVQPLHALPMAVQHAISDIKIEGHIYDADPHARMVIINGKVRKEKQTVGSGMTLQEITPDGVIINYQSRVFHIGVFD